MPQGGQFPYAGRLRPPRVIAGTSVIVHPTDADGSVRTTSDSAVTFNCPDLPPGVFVLVIQAGDGVITFAGIEGVVVENRQGQLSSAGKGALCSVVYDAEGHVWIGGDTA